MTSDPTLKDIPWLGFDTETTGVNPRQDRVVTAALITLDNGQITDQRSWLANPGVEIPAAAVAVHGITNEKARSEGMPLQMVLEQVAAGITDTWQRGGALVGFNITFDLAILDFGLQREGLPTLSQRLGTGLGPVVDPLVIDRGLDRKRSGKRRLVDVCQAYGVEVGTDFHAADFDVIATLRILQAQLERFPELAQLPLRELNTWQARLYANWAHSFNKWLAEKGRSANLSPEWLSF